MAAVKCVWDVMYYLHIRPVTGAIQISFDRITPEFHEQIDWQSVQSVQSVQLPFDWPSHVALELVASLFERWKGESPLPNFPDKWLRTVRTWTKLLDRLN